jgi:hypothetical protein
MAFDQKTKSIVLIPAGVLGAYDTEADAISAAQAALTSPEMEVFAAWVVPAIQVTGTP